MLRLVAASSRSVQMVGRNAGMGRWAMLCSDAIRRQAEIQREEAERHYTVFGNKPLPGEHRSSNKEAEWRELNARSRPSGKEADEVLRKRIRWAATKRGWVETQEMLVPFVDVHLADMDRKVGHRPKKTGD